MVKNKRIIGIISVVLSVIMIAASMLPVALAYEKPVISVNESELGDDTYLTSKYDYIVSPGVLETQITVNSKKGNHQVKGYAVQVDMSNGLNSIIAGYANYDGTKWDRQTVSEQAAAAESVRGVNVVAGVNADFFSKTDGRPLGILVMNGQICNNVYNYPYFAILSDGSAVIANGGTVLTGIQEAVAGYMIIADNGKVTAQAESDTSLNPRTAVGVTADGNVVMLVDDGRQSPTSVGVTCGDLGRQMVALGCVRALCLDGGGSSTYISQHEGSTSLEVRNSPCYTTERPVSDTLFVCTSAKATGVFDHVAIVPESKSIKPFSFQNLTVTGTDTNGFPVSLPSGGKLVVKDSVYGRILGNVFYSNANQGTVEIDYIYNGDVLGSAYITVSSSAPSKADESFYSLIQKIASLQQLIQFVFQKLQSYIQNPGNINSILP